MRMLPSVLTALRLMLAPTILLNAVSSHNPWLFLVSLLVGFISDIFDGILARRLGVATDRLRRFDSLTDLVFWSCVFAAIWIVDPAVVRADAVALSLLLALEFFGQMLALVLSGKPAAVHSYLAKLWGICLFLASCEVLVGGTADVLFKVMLVVGLVMYAEWISIIVLTRARSVDVGSVFCAKRSAPWRDGFERLFHNLAEPGCVGPVWRYSAARLAPPVGPQTISQPGGLIFCRSSSGSERFFAASSIALASSSIGLSPESAALMESTIFCA